MDLCYVSSPHLSRLGPVPGGVPFLSPQYVTIEKWGNLCHRSTEHFPKIARRTPQQFHNSQATQARYILCSLTYKPVNISKKGVDLKHIQDTKLWVAASQRLPTPQHSDVILLVHFPLI